jgi:hypothetical protein
VAEPRSAFRRLVALLVAASLVLGAFVGMSASARGAAYPGLPIAYDSTFLSNLTGPDLAPGNSGSIGFHVADPARFAAMTGVTLTLDVYAFNAFPGNATSSVAAAGTPVLVTPTGSGTVVNLSLPSLTPGTEEASSVGVATATNTPTGAFAVRTALAFVANGTGYRLESRGWFAASLWDAATTLPNGSVTLNLSVLGVSGVTAETSILVSSSSWDWALALILGAALVLLGAGAFVYFRRESKSSSGAR